MEYGGDRTLAQELHDEGRFEVRRALHIMSQVLDALFEAHQMGIVHRDLKPANVLLGVRGGEEWVKVVDVGIAKVMAGDDEGQPDERLTGTGMVLGTPSYYSPEQARGLAIDGRSDLYAAGIVLYEMLTGQLPIKGRTPIDYVRAHAVDAPTPARKYGVSLPEGVEKIIVKALQKDPGKRYANAREMKAAVDAALQALPRRAGESRVPWRPIAIAAAASLVLVGGIVAGVQLGAVDRVTRWKAARVAPKPPPEPPPEPARQAAAPAAPPQPAPGPVAAAVKPGKLLVRAPGAEVRITGATATGSDVEIAGKSGAFTVQDDADGWSVAVKYRRAGAGLALTVESTPPALVYFEDSPLGRVGAIRLGAAPAQIVFRRPTGGEFALIVKYAP
ncbi:MAG: serine/threonine protein kinase, partial [Myxococcales bacterium]|nr:serine/threonine protein kinase [Myxococcales bacterium]